MADRRREMMRKFDKMKARQANRDTDSSSNKKNDDSQRRRRRKKNKKNDEEQPPAPTKKKSRFSCFVDDVFMSVREFKKKKLPDSISFRQRKEKKRKSRLGRDNGPKTSHDVPTTDAERENICKFLTDVFGLGVQGILQQYQTYLKTYVPPDVTREAFDKHMDKNRYKDVVCIDQTRVIIKDTDQDYIHANHVRGEPFINPFICTQGPMKGTVDDFWMMLMQEKVSHIFMLCNVIETGKTRCQQYWPLEVGTTAEHAGVTITNVSVDDDDSTLIVTMLEAEGRGDKLIIKHVRWKNWPDKGVPSSVFAPFRMLKMARQSVARPTVVHCSAGIGRTGCIVAAEFCVQVLLSGKPLDLVPAIQKLRTMRMSAVQTDTQLVYVARCLLAYANSCGVMQGKDELTEKGTKFESDYEEYLANKAKEAVAVKGEGTKTVTSAEQVSNTGCDTERTNIDKPSVEKKEKRIADDAKGESADCAKPNSDAAKEPENLDAMAASNNAPQPAQPTDLAANS